MYICLIKVKPTSICCTVRSKKVESLRTCIRLLGPTQPILVPNPPLSLITMSLLKRNLNWSLETLGREE